MKDYSTMESELAKDLLAALQENDKSKEKPIWWYALERFGLPTIIVLVLMWFAYTKGGAWVDSLVENTKASQEANSIFLKAQVDAVKALADEAKIEREFENEVMAVHKQQVDELKTIAEVAKDTNNGLKQCQTQMAEVPALRQQELTLLQEIRDELKSDGT